MLAYLSRLFSIPFFPAYFWKFYIPYYYHRILKMLQW